MGVLTLADRKVLDRLCLEHMNHAGTENGNLVCTYSDFEQFGIRRASIAYALRRLKALGFIEVVEQGRICRAEFKHAAKYRVTFVQGNLAPTDEWKQIKIREQAECLAAAACQKPKKPRQVPRKNKIPDAKTLPLRSIPGRENATPVPDAKTLPLSISRKGSPQIVENVAACPAKLKSQGSAVCGIKPQSWQRLSDVIPLPKQSSLQKG